MLAEVQRVVIEPVEVLEQIVAAQTPVAHEVVEALHMVALSSAGNVPSSTGRPATSPAKRSR
ncbi:MAG TPA: hypothetical protein VHF51_11635 [Solirubrobacteraceae bacterium]|nr:hypothetical protein [Solirubrobacteraceae bacterium]